jgi:hypothetical protein
VYAGDLPAFLDYSPLKDCLSQRYTFDLADRIFTLVPSWVQILAYSVSGAVVLGILHFWLKTYLWWQIIPLSLSISTLYILLFPYLPTRSFVYKGIFLFILLALGLSVIFYFAPLELWSSRFYLMYMAGFSILFGLYYTGNSGVSNYSIVKKETVIFMPISVLLLVAALVMVIIKGVQA